MFSYIVEESSNPGEIGYRSGSKTCWSQQPLVFNIVVVVG